MIDRKHTFLVSAVGDMRWVEDLPRQHPVFKDFMMQVSIGGTEFRL